MAIAARTMSASTRLLMVQLDVPIDMTNSSRATPQRFHGRLFLLLGVALAVMGVAAYAVQISLQRLMAPWYMPILASLGVVLVFMSMLQSRTVWRVLALLAIVGLASAEWAILYALRLPAYTGPIAAGQPFPAFEAIRADGTPFTERDLAGDNHNVLVFFRGRW
jgi:hypothetical protein